MNVFVQAFAWIFSPDSGRTRIHSSRGARAPGLHLLRHAGRGADRRPAGLADRAHRQGARVRGGISGAARAIPSFGLLILLVLLFGVLSTPEAALTTFVLLAIPSILAGAYTGFEAIDRKVIDAARSMGMTPWQMLWRVEVPLGLSLLVAGCARQRCRWWRPSRWRRT